MSSLTRDAYILCGGQSNRMGRDKASLPLAGKRLVDWLIEAIRGAGFQPHVVLKTSQRLETTVPIVREASSAQHPLIGVATALRHCSRDFALILPCDVPLLEVSSLQSLTALHQATFALGAEPEPLLLWLPTRLADKAERFAKHNRSVREFIEGFAPCQLPQSELLNLNTPEVHYEAARKLSSRANR